MTVDTEFWKEDLVQFRDCGRCLGWGERGDAEGVTERQPQDPVDGSPQQMVRKEVRTQGDQPLIKFLLESGE